LHYRWRERFFGKRLSIRLTLPIGGSNERADAPEHVEGISLGVVWMDEPQSLGFLGLVDLIGLEMILGGVQWFEYYWSSYLTQRGLDH